MRAIEDLLSASAEISTAELEQEKHARDLEIQRLRAEQLALHDILEPQWIAAEGLKAGPANLAQRVDTADVTPSKLSGFSFTELKRHAQQLMEEITKRGGGE